MLKLAIAYLSTGLIFLALDAEFLTFAGSRLYRPALDSLLADKVRGGPAVVFYLIYVAGMVYFCVQPAIAEGWRKALISGAFFGLVAYGTYDLTCFAVMRVWSLPVTVADMAWGAFATGIASMAGVLIAQAAVKQMVG